MKRDREPEVARRVAVVVRLDASGSMEPFAENMVHAYNAWLRGVVAAVDAEAYADVATFNGSVQSVYRGPLAGAAPLSVARYVCEGGTALHDAVGGAVEWIRSASGGGGEFDDVALLVATDGVNNVTPADGRDALSIDLALRALRRAERPRVRVVFLCAGSEAQYAAECMGVSATGENGDVMVAVQAAGELAASLASQHVIDACSQPPVTLHSDNDNAEVAQFATQCSASL